jgi:hypothetical protein
LRNLNDAFPNSTRILPLIRIRIENAFFLRN